MTSLVSKTLFQLGGLTKHVGLTPLRNHLANQVDLILKKVSSPPICVSLGKYKLCGYLRHARFLKIVSSSGFESYVHALAHSLVKPSTVVVDGGAHIGLFSLILAAQPDFGGRVLAFEPDPFNYYTLCYNVENNQCETIIPYQVALSDSCGELVFHRGQSSLSGSLVNRRDVDRAEQVLVKTTTLDQELVGQAVNSLLIKLDLEGAEPSALLGMKETFQRVSQIAMIIEVNPSALQSGGSSPQILVELIKSFGFSVQYINEEKQTLVPLDSLTQLDKGNLYCTKGY